MAGIDRWLHYTVTTIDRFHALYIYWHATIASTDNRLTPALTAMGKTTTDFLGSLFYVDKTLHAWFTENKEPMVAILWQFDLGLMYIICLRHASSIGHHPLSSGLSNLTGKHASNITLQIKRYFSYCFQAYHNGEGEQLAKHINYS